jgi:hypothetical protein
MQLTTNLPSGSNTAQNYIVRRADTRLPSNVRPEVDAAYISEKGLRSSNERGGTLTEQRRKYEPQTNFYAHCRN